MKSPQRLARYVLAIAFCGWLGSALAVEDGTSPPATNSLERMHIRNAKCTWTKEIGDYIYQCLKDNFGMNAHWCHNEAMEVFCPKQLGSTDAAEKDAAPPAK